MQEGLPQNQQLSNSQPQVGNEAAAQTVTAQPQGEGGGKDDEWSLDFLKSFWFWLIASFFLILLSVFWFFVYPRLGNYISIPNQRVVDSFHVDAVRVSTNSILALYLINGFEGREKSLIANTGVLLPDTYRDFILPVDSPDFSDLTDEEKRELFVPGKKVEAVLLKDNGDGGFDPQTDTGIVRDIFGNKIEITFTLK